MTLEDPLSGEHAQLIKKKIAQNNTLGTIKDNHQSTNKNILQCLHDNIIDQTGAESIQNFSSVFELTPKETKEEKEEKIKQLFKLFGENYTYVVREDWFKFKIITCDCCFKCTEEEIINQLNNTYEKMMQMRRKLGEDRAVTPSS